MDQMIESLNKDWQSLVTFSPRIIAAAAVLTGFFFLGKYFSKLLVAVIRRASVKEIHEAFFRALTLTVAMFFGLVIALNILGLERIAVSILAGGGVTAVILGFAFREIGENFLAGIFLAFSRPFKIGDLIKSEDIEGYVREIELRYTHLRTEDGKDVYVPSSQLFSRPVTNYTRDGLRRISFTVGIDYANDAAAACALLAKTIPGVDGVLKQPEPQVYILALAPQYVELQAFFWIDVFAKSSPLLRIQTQVLDECRKALLEGAYTVSADTTSNIALSGRLDSGARNG